jgi:hypothetical protein
LEVDSGGYSYPFDEALELARRFCIAEPAALLLEMESGFVEKLAMLVAVRIALVVNTPAWVHLRVQYGSNKSFLELFSALLRIDK